MKPVIRLSDIKSIHPPVVDELNLEESIEWREKLYPFYNNRSEILTEFGIEQWKKAMLWIRLYHRAETLRKAN